MWELLGILVVLGLPVAAIALPLWLLAINRRSHEAIARVARLERRQQEDAALIEWLRAQLQNRQPSQGQTDSHPGDGFAQQRSAAPAPADAPTATAPPVTAPAAAAPYASAPPPPVPPPAPQTATAPEMETSPASPAPPPPFAPSTVDAGWQQTAGQSAAPPPPLVDTPVAAASGAAGDEPFAATQPDASLPPATDWETRVGANWLSKLGVAAMVIGLALFVGYSFTTMGAWGRISLSALLSVGMLASGILFERRESYRVLGRGLIAGGWAGGYLTTFAAYGVEAARVIENPGVATALLFAVAAGMVIHSLRYRSQALTSLSFVLAALSLAISDSFGFALGALLPLAAALLLVSHRMRWPVLRASGSLASFAAAALLLFFGGEVMQTTAFSGTVIALWLLFELGAWMSIRRGDTPHAAEFLLAAANTLALAGLLAGNGGLAELNSPETPRLQLALLTSGCLLALGAAVRGWLHGLAPTQQDPLLLHLRRGGYLPLALTGTACLAAFLLLRFTGAWEMGSLLALGLALVALAIAFGQRYLARIADGLFSFTLLRVYTGDLSREPLFQFAQSSWSERSLFALAHTAVFYLNRGFFPRRAYYSAVGTLVLLVTLAETLPPLWLGFAYLLASLGLLEAARRSRHASTLAEGMVTVGAAMLACAVTWLEMEMEAALPWQPVAATAVLFYAASWQLLRANRETLQEASSLAAARILEQGVLVVAGACAALGIFQLVPEMWVPAGWMLLALAWTLATQWDARPVWDAKAMGLGVLAVTVLLAVGSSGLAIPLGDPRFWLVHLLPAGAAFGMWWRYLEQRSLTGSSDLVRWLGWLPSALAVTMLAELAANAVSGVWVGLWWLLLAVLLTLAGVLARKTELRVEGYTVAALGALLSVFQLADPVADWFQGLHELVAGGLGTLGLLAMFLVTLRLPKLAREAPEATWPWEPRMPTAFALAAGAFAVRVMFLVVEGRLLTMALGFEAIVLLALGVLVNLRALRLGALGLLLFAVGKLFLYDLASLVMPYRIASFFVLGGLLLAVSWAYSRYGERMRRLL